MNNAQFYPNNAYANPYGVNYAVPAKPQAKNGQPLTQEEINHLRSMSGAETLDIKISTDDVLIAKCTHREKNGTDSLVNLGGDRWRCTICGQEFNMFNGTVEEVTNAVGTIIDILQTSKSIYRDAPDSLTGQYYQLIPLLKKLPNVFQASLNNFSKYENWQQAPEFTANGYYPGFTAMHNLLTGQFMPGMAPGYGYQQPAYGYQQPMMQPMQGGYAPNPVVTPQPTAGYYQQPVMQQYDPSGNPLAYGAPVAPAPVAPAPGAIPAAPVAAPAAAPAAQSEVQQTAVFNV